MHSDRNITNTGTVKNKKYIFICFKMQKGGKSKNGGSHHSTLMILSAQHLCDLSQHIFCREDTFDQGRAEWLRKVQDIL